MMFVFNVTVLKAMPVGPYDQSNANGTTNASAQQAATVVNAATGLQVINYYNPDYVHSVIPQHYADDFPGAHTVAPMAHYANTAQNAHGNAKQAG